MILILWVLIVLELFRLVREHYPGIGVFARTLLLAALAIASVVAILSVGPDARGIDWHRPALQIIVLLNRYVATVLTFFLFALAVFLHYYHAPIRPNVLRHAYILAGYFSVQAAAMFLTNLIGPTSANTNRLAGVFDTYAMTQINRGLMIGSIGCFFAWALLLTRRGEGLPMSPALSKSDLEMIERRDRELMATVRWLAK